MDLQDARRFALSLPETTEAPHFEMSSFRAGGKIFATVPTDGVHLHVFVDEHETRAWVAEDPAAFEELWWGKQLAGVRVNLSAAPEQSVYEMLEDSWRRRAPKRVVAARDAGPPSAQKPDVQEALDRMAALRKPRKGRGLSLKEIREHIDEGRH